MLSTINPLGYSTSPPVMDHFSPGTCRPAEHYELIILPRHWRCLCLRPAQQTSYRLVSIPLRRRVKYSWGSWEGDGIGQAKETTTNGQLLAAESRLGVNHHETRCCCLCLSASRPISGGRSADSWLAMMTIDRTPQSACSEQHQCPYCVSQRKKQRKRVRWTSLHQSGQNLRGPHVTRQQQLSIDIRCGLAANPPAAAAAVDRRDRRTVGRTDTRPLYDAYFVLCGPRNNSVNL